MSVSRGVSFARPLIPENAQNAYGKVFFYGFLKQNKSA